MQLAAGWLLYQAETFEERNDYLEWYSKGNLPEITHALDIKFHRVAPEMVKANRINIDMCSQSGNSVLQNLHNSMLGSCGDKGTILVSLQLFSTPSTFRAGRCHFLGWRQTRFR